MKQNKAVIFDLDGTILDSLEELYEAVNYSLQKWGYPPRTRHEVRDFLGNGAAYLLRCALPADAECPDFETFLAEYKAYYEAHSHVKTKPFPGICTLLERLNDAGYGTAVVSNKPDGAVKLLCRHNFGERLQFVLGDREGVERKPSAEPVKLAMESLECDEAIFVGDTEVDLATACNAGIPCILMTWGYRDREDMERIGANFFADSAERLAEILEEQFGIILEEN